LAAQAESQGLIFVLRYRFGEAERAVKRWLPAGKVLRKANYRIGPGAPNPKARFLKEYLFRG
jgi:hypothetical protein